MAVQTGTAKNAEELYEKLVIFLTEGSGLKAENALWEKKWQTPRDAINASDLVLQGKGIPGGSRPLVGLRRQGNTLHCCGLTGILPGANAYNHHVNPTPERVRMFMDDLTMTYWFVANPRRFVVVLKISTVFEAMYAGLFLPYTTPVSWPYPLFVGGSAGQGGPKDWRSLADTHTHFVNPDAEYGGIRSPSWMLDPSATWREMAAYSGAQYHLHPSMMRGGGFGDSDYDYRLYVLLRAIAEPYGGGRLLLPHMLFRTSPIPQTYGILDGVFMCSGSNPVAESEITVNSTPHLVVQNVFRTGAGQFWALALE